MELVNNKELDKKFYPTDEEINLIDPLKRLELIHNKKLDKRFFPTDEEIYEEISNHKNSPIFKIYFCIKYNLPKKFFPTDEEIFSIDPLERMELINDNKLDKKYFPSVPELITIYKNKKNNALEIFQFILKNKIDDLDLFMIAVTKGIFKVVDVKEIIHVVISKGLINIMRFLLIKKVKINELIKYGVGYQSISYNTLDGLCGILTPAIVGDQKEMIDFLIDNGADINADQYIIYAILHNPDLIQYLIDKGADVNKMGRYLDYWIKKEFPISSFEVAINLEKIDIAKFLINNGFELNRTEIERLWSKYRFVRESEKYLRYLLKLKKYSE